MYVKITPPKLMILVLPSAPGPVFNFVNSTKFTSIVFTWDPLMNLMESLSDMRSLTELVMATFRLLI